MIGAQPPAPAWAIEPVYLGRKQPWDALTVGDERASGAEVAVHGTFALPVLQSGDYQAVFQVDPSNQVGELLPNGHINNALIAQQVIPIDNPDLTPGITMEGDWSSGPTDRAFDFQVSPRSNLRVTFATDVPAVMLASLDFLPTPRRFDYQADAGQSFTIPNTGDETLSGTLRITANAPLPPGSLEFQIVPELLGDQLTAVTPPQGGNTGTVTVLVHGGPFDGQTVFELRRQGTVIAAERSREFEEGNVAAVTFDMAAQPPGDYDVVATFSNAAVSTLPAAFHSLDGGKPAHIEYRLDGPSIVRAGQPNSYTLTWTNTGDVDAAVRVATLTAPDGTIFTFAPNDKKEFASVGFFTTVAETTDPATVPPGASASVNIWVTAPAGQTQFGLDLGAVAIDAPVLIPLPIDWVVLLQAASLPSADPLKWGQMAAGVASDLGATIAQSLWNLVAMVDLDPSADISRPSLARSRAAIQQGASQVEKSLADVMGENYPAPSAPSAGAGLQPEGKESSATGAGGDPPLEGDGLHRDFVIIVAILDKSATVAQEEFRPDVTGGKDALVDFYRNHLNIPRGQITVLDESRFASRKISPSDIARAWQETVAKADADDKIKFHYIGHGRISDRGEGKLVLNGNVQVGDRKFEAILQPRMPGQLLLVMDVVVGGHIGENAVLVHGARSTRVEIATGGDFNLRHAQFSKNWAAAQEDKSNDQDGDGKVTLDEARHDWFFETRLNVQVAASIVNQLILGEDAPIPRVTNRGFDQELRDDIGEMGRKQSFGLLDVYKAWFEGVLEFRILNLFSSDPNEKTGPLGTGSENYVADVEPFPYTIRFENDSEFANAAAQVVTVTDQLSPDLDWDTFQFREVAFGDDTVPLVGSASAASASVYDLQSGLIVDIVANFDRATGVATWTFSSIDVRTGEPTLDPLAGFLPVNITSPEGEGHVTYRVSPRSDVTTGTQIANGASIVFDVNDPIITNRHIVTFDFDVPTSSVNALPAESPPTFTVSRNGTDAGSGIAFYDVFVSVDGGPFNPFVLNTTQTSADFTGEVDRQYAFYSVATDNVGNRQVTPSAAQAITTVVDVPPTVIRVKVGSAVGAGDDWSSAFRNAVDPDAGIGYPIPHGTHQLDPLPWGNIRQIYVEFSEDVGAVTADDIRLVGVNTPNYEIADVTYDAAAHRATITLTSPQRVDKLLLVVKDTVTDSAGLRLDGDWTDEVSMGASGDGSAGGDFRFRFNVLPGDTNRSEGVAVNDVAALRAGLGTGIGADLYSFFADLNGSGGLAVNDAMPIGVNLGQTLPAIEPSIPTAASALAPNTSPAFADLDAAAHARLLGKATSEQKDADSMDPILNDIAGDVLTASSGRTKRLRAPRLRGFVV